MFKVVSKLTYAGGVLVVPCKPFELNENVEYEVTIKPYKKTRSLDANAYAWVLIGNLSKVLKIPKDEIYRKAIKDIGEYTIVPIADTKVKDFMDVWGSRGIGWIAEVLAPSKHEGYTNIMLYTGSSVYNTSEMNRLIEWLVDECREHGIQTMEEENLRSLVESWHGQR